MTLFITLLLVVKGVNIGVEVQDVAYCNQSHGEPCGAHKANKNLVAFSLSQSWGSAVSAPPCFE